jgi:hypothetical protein
VEGKSCCDTMKACADEDKKACTEDMKAGCSTDESKACCDEDKTSTAAHESHAEKVVEREKAKREENATAEAE